MDLSLATDPYGSAYYHQHHYLQQQQQQQQQQQHHHQQQQPQELQHNQHQQQLQPQEQHHQQHHYAYHHSQHYQDLSLAPPSGAAPLSSSTAATLPYHHISMPSHSSGQLRPRMSSNLNMAHVGASQQLQYSPAQAAAAVANPHVFDSSGYNSASQVPSDDQVAQYSSLHTWATEPSSSQWSEHQFDNCLPPGVEPSSAPCATSAVFPSTNASLPYSQPHLQPPLHHLQAHLQSHPQPPVHPSLHHLQPHVQPYQPLQPYVPFGTGRSPQKLWPRKKPVKGGAPRKIPVVKATSMKATGSAPVIPFDNKGRGWCSVCERNCVTEVALKQHLEGKGHKKRVAIQKEKAEAAATTAEEDGDVANILEQVWVQVTMMGKPARKTEKGKRRPKVKEEGKGQPKDVGGTAEGEPINIRTGGAKASNERVIEVVRCDICNVDCNTKAVLEIHCKGKRHAARLKKLQQSCVARNPEQPCLTSDPKQLPSMSYSEQRTVVLDLEQTTSVLDPEQCTLGTNVEQTTLMTDLEKPTLMTDEEQPNLTTDAEEPAVMTDEEQPNLTTDAEEPAVMTDVEQPTLIIEQEPSNLVTDH